ncbi:MAG TPA: alpha/beta hydrolase, partial [Candidatus Nitrosocosmicus sp.]|nr:alpha/beta hydrolase [Candidatus Nitrosocosmicus sp.]
VCRNEQINCPADQLINLMFIPGVLGETAATGTIGPAIIRELPEVDTIVGYNSALSESALRLEYLSDSLKEHARQIVDLYEHSIPEDQKDLPLIVSAHSMGAATAPLVARELLERGFNLKQLILISSPGLVKRSRAELWKNFFEINLPEHIDVDTPLLYPSPYNIARFIKEYRKLTEIQNTRLLTPDESDSLAYYELVFKRYKNPEPNFMSNLTEQEKETVKRIDHQMHYLLRQKGLSRSGLGIRNDALHKLEKERLNLLRKRVWQAIGAVVNNEPLNIPSGKSNNRVIGENLLKPRRKQINNIVAKLADTVTVQAIQDLVDYANEHHPEASFDIALVGGKDRIDPIIGDYEVGGVNKWKVGPKITYSEVALKNFDHLTLASDPKRMAQVIQRILER